MSIKGFTFLTTKVNITCTRFKCLQDPCIHLIITGKCQQGNILFIKKNQFVDKTIHRKW